MPSKLVERGRIGGKLDLRHPNEFVPYGPQAKTGKLLVNRAGALRARTWIQFAASFLSY
jgi:hypothetical protein